PYFFPSNAGHTGAPREPSRSYPKRFPHSSARAATLSCRDGNARARWRNLRQARRTQWRCALRARRAVRRLRRLAERIRFDRDEARLGAHALEPSFHRGVDAISDGLGRLRVSKERDVGDAVATVDEEVARGKVAGHHVERRLPARLQELDTLRI